MRNEHCTDGDAGTAGRKTAPSRIPHGLKNGNRTHGVRLAQRQQAATGRACRYPYRNPSRTCAAPTAAQRAVTQTRTKAAHQGSGCNRLDLLPHNDCATVRAALPTTLPTTGVPR